MKNFNKVITVEVSVDSIANQLLQTLSPEFKHREMVTEGIIGRMLSSDMHGLSILYNSLNGFTQEIDFQVGEVVKVENLNFYGYWFANTDGNLKESREKVSEGVVKSIDIYSDKKIELEFNVPDSKGQMKTNTQWVSHTNCSKIEELAIVHSY